MELTIIICTRNRARFLGRCLDAIGQIKSCHKWNAFIVDNNSNDDTESVIKAAASRNSKIIYKKVERVGLGAARDAAWRITSANIISFTDDDCYVDSNYVDAVIAAFNEHKEAGCIGGRILLYDPEDAPEIIDERDTRVKIEPYQFVDAGALHGANLSFRRTVLERVGGFDPHLGAGTPFPCEDIDVIAASLWSGNTAYFEPTPIVWHHHRRRKADVVELFERYDRGRGSYYAKYLKKTDTRPSYLRGWWNIAKKYDEIWGVIRLGREMVGAFQYLKYRRELAFLAVAIPVGFFVYFYVALPIILRHFTTKALSRLRHSS